MTGRVVVVGDALIDELRDSRGVREFVGGAALNVAVGLSRLGVPATLIAMVGSDTDGERIRSYLADFGVDLIATMSERGSARAISERIGGEPAYGFNSASRHRHIAFGDQERAALGEAAAIVVSCMALDDRDQVADLFSALQSAPGSLFVDPNPRLGMLRNRDLFAQGLERLAPRAHVIKLSDEDADVIYRRSLATVRERLQRLGTRVIVSTLGSEGARVDADEVIERGAAALMGKVIDTMGAGDSVMASIVASVLESNGDVDWARALERAMDIAAATVRHEGALLQIPSQPGENYDRIGT